MKCKLILSIKYKSFRSNKLFRESATPQQQQNYSTITLMPLIAPRGHHAPTEPKPAEVMYAQNTIVVVCAVARVSRSADAAFQLFIQFIQLGASVC